MQNGLVKEGFPRAARPVKEGEERTLFSDGQATPVIDRIFSPEEVAEAHRVMEANANFGKLLMRWE